MQQKIKVKFISSDKNLFYNTLRKRVDQFFLDKQVTSHANHTMIIKTIALLLGYILPFVVFLVIQPGLWLSVALWLMMGISLAGIGMSIMHDANHGAYSEKKYVNSLVGYSLNLIGGSVFNWKLQHNIMHHTYTNIAHMDDDIEDKAILRFSPHTKLKIVHQLQYIYAILMYGLITLYWVTVKDFVLYFKYIKNGVNTNKPKQNAALMARLIIMKSLYFAIMLVMPVFLFSVPFYIVLTGFLIMHFAAGIILTVIFQLAHTVEGTSHPLPNENGNIENSWAIHQMNTTVNFSPDNKWLSWYVGGLNFQVEHHLFPRICHVHYPAIAKIVKSTAQEFDIPYLENNTFLKAFRSHIATLHRFGNIPTLNEAVS